MLHRSIKHPLNAAMLCMAVLGFTACYAAEDASAKKSSGKSFSAGLNISDKASAEETGLPLYPGATPDRSYEKSGDGDSVNVGLWGGSFGLKVVVAKLKTNDSPEKVAAFYQKALAQYGKVLDCKKQRDETSEPKESDGDVKPLTCGKEAPEGRDQVFKSGTRRQQHVVAIESRKEGTAFQLIYVETRGVNIQFDSGSSK